VPSVFFDIQLPSPLVWFLMAFSLAFVSFFQFVRPLTLRNWDLLALFGFAPGFLLLEEARRMDDIGLRYAGYGWLLLQAAWWFARCLIDTRMDRRVRFPCNLTRPALIALAVCVVGGVLGMLSFRSTESQLFGKPPGLFRGVETTATAVIQQAQFNTAEQGDLVKFWVMRGLSVVCHILVMTLLATICRQHFQDRTAAAAAPLLYMLLPATTFAFDQSHHVWPTAFVLAAVCSYRNAMWAGVFLGIAAGTSFFPLVLLPVWLQFYRQRGQGMFALGFGIAAVTAAAIAVALLSLAGQYTTGLWQTFHLADWQPWTVPTAESIWMGGRWIYRLPVFVVYIAFVGFLFIWPSVKNLGQLLAASAAALIGIQFWFADRGGVYVLWFAPLLILMMLRPTAAELQPPRDVRKAFFGWPRRAELPEAVPTPGIAV